MCASDVGNISKVTCKEKTKPMIKSSLQNFIIGCIMLFALLVTSLLVVKLRNKQAKYEMDYKKI